nr:DUF1800 family protein [Micromonospora sp. DSM 115978]
MTASAATALTERRAEIAHLYRRLGFGASPAEIDAGAAAGYETTVDEVLAAAVSVASAEADDPLVGHDFAYQPPPGSEAGAAATRAYRRELRDEVAAATTAWLDRMAATASPVVEKLTLGWHDHWATSVQKVRSAPLMVAQNATLRRHCLGRFGEFAAAMVVDPAMLLWLDGPRNRAGSPNENLGRELMELFVLGVGEYSESDVREASRALTGWTVERDSGA